MLKRNKKEDKDVDLKPYTKNKRSKGLVIGMSLGVLVTVGSIVLYRSYAIYKEEKNYNIIQGIVPDFNYDVKVAITVDEDTNVEQVPERTDGNGKYYEVNVDCQNDGQPVDGEWDYNAWNLKIDDAKSGTKCDLQFTSNLPEADYQEYIKEGIALRRNTYRGKDLSSYFSDNNGEEFYKQIREGTFGDIFVGDYITTKVGEENITWLIADIDNYMNTSCNGTGCTEQKLTQHHLTIIPAYFLGEKGKMYLTAESLAATDGGYANSDMVKATKDDSTGIGTESNTLKTIYEKYINCGNCTFHNHILTYRNFLTDKIDKTATNRMGGNQNFGASSSASWYQRKLDLMSEVNVYGTTVFSSSGWDTGMDHQQYAIFRLKPEFIYSDGKTPFDYWLKDVVSSTNFAHVWYTGGSLDASAINDAGIRPRFLVGGTAQN